MLAQFGIGFLHTTGEHAQTLRYPLRIVTKERLYGGVVCILDVVQVLVRQFSGDAARHVNEHTPPERTAECRNLVSQYVYTEFV